MKSSSKKLNRQKWKMTSGTYIFFHFFQFFLRVPWNKKGPCNRKAEMNVSVFDGCTQSDPENRGPQKVKGHWSKLIASSSSFPWRINPLPVDTLASGPFHSFYFFFYFSLNLKCPPSNSPTRLPLSKARAKQLFFWDQANN